MFNRLGRITTHHPWAVLSTWALITALGLMASFWGFGHGDLFSRLAVTAPSTPGSQSDRVAQLTADEDTGPVTTVVVSGIPIQHNLPDLVAFTAEYRSNFSEIDHVVSVIDPFITSPAHPVPDLTDPHNQALLSTNGDGFAVVITAEKQTSDADAKATKTKIDEAISTFTAALTEKFPDAQVNAISQALVSDGIIALIQSDLVRGETIGLPVALVLMLVVFGGLVAAGLPLGGAVISILLGMAGIWVSTFFMDFNSFILNVVSIIGLALSIDYGLLVVSRCREEFAIELTRRGLPADGSSLPDRASTHTLVRAAVERTVRTAGRTVFFSALTIACSISGLLVFDSPTLRGITIGGMLVTILAVLTSISVVPALITLLGVVLIRPSRTSRVPGLAQLTRLVGDSSAEEGFFSSVARWVHRIPWAMILLIGMMLAVMASPLSGLRMRSSFIEYLPDDSPALIAHYQLQDGYPALATPQIIVAAKVNQAQSAQLVQYLTAQDHVAHVIPAERPLADGMTEFGVHMDTSDPTGAEVSSLVHELRDHDPGYEILVGGAAAMQEDFAASLADGAPLALLIVAVAVFILLFLMTGSLAIPLKALIVNSLSLMASLGATVWIFEGGHLGMTPTNGLETYIVAIMIAFGFGLSMDYEVFLVARMKEYWDAGLPNDRAVAQGLQRSGRIITSAAAIIVAVFIGFISGQMIAIKQIGVALAIMVTVDATLVRLLLVPATMEVLGRWNWWAPAPLRWIHDRFRIEH